MLIKTIFRDIRAARKSTNIEMKRNCNTVRSFVVELLDYYFAIVFLYLAVIRAYRITCESHADRHELAEHTVYHSCEKEDCALITLIILKSRKNRRKDGLNILANCKYNADKRVYAPIDICI